MQKQFRGNELLVLLSWIRRSLVATVMVFMLTSLAHAEEQQPVSPSGFGNISSRQNDPAVIAAGLAQEHYSSDPIKEALQVDQAQTPPKKKISAKKIALLACVVLFVVFVMFNFIATFHNNRICSECGYIGSMKAKSLSDKPFLDSLLKLLIALFPVLLYYYSERGRFICPVCYRTSTNMSLRRKLKQDVA